jgi:hypothetical protein
VVLEPSVAVPLQPVEPSVAVPLQPVEPSVAVPLQPVEPSVAVPLQPVEPSVGFSAAVPLFQPRAVVFSVVFLLQNPRLRLYHSSRA